MGTRSHAQLHREAKVLREAKIGVLKQCWRLFLAVFMSFVGTYSITDSAGSEVAAASALREVAAASALGKPPPPSAGAPPRSTRFTRVSSIAEEGGGSKPPLARALSQRVSVAAGVQTLRKMILDTEEAAAELRLKLRSATKQRDAALQSASDLEAKLGDATEALAEDKAKVLGILAVALEKMAAFKERAHAASRKRKKHDKGASPPPWRELSKQLKGVVGALKRAKLLAETHFEQHDAFFTRARN